MGAKVNILNTAKLDRDSFNKSNIDQVSTVISKVVYSPSARIYALILCSLLICVIKPQLLPLSKLLQQPLLTEHIMIKSVF